MMGSESAKVIMGKFWKVLVHLVHKFWFNVDFRESEMYLLENAFWSSYGMHLLL